MSESDLEHDLQQYREKFRRFSVINWMLYRRGDLGRHGAGYADASSEMVDELDEILEHYFNDDTTTMVLDVSSTDVAREVGYGILGRAMDVHDNPDDELEPVAEELRELGQNVIEVYEAEADSLQEEVDGE
jgi:hypothetical protein